MASTMADRVGHKSTTTKPLLFEILGLNDYPTYLLKRGKGIRKWDSFQNSEKTFQKGFYADVQARVKRRHGLRDTDFETPVALARVRCSSCSEPIPLSGRPTLRKGKLSTCQRENEESSRPPQITERFINSSERSVDLKQVLNDPSVNRLQVEGHSCTKRDLAEWANKYQDKTNVKITRDQSSQTMILQEPRQSTSSVTENVASRRAPEDSVDSSKLAVGTNRSNNGCRTEDGVNPNSNQHSNTTTLPSLMSAATYPQRGADQVQGTSLLGDFYQNQQYYAPHQIPFFGVHPGLLRNPPGQVNHQFYSVNSPNDWNAKYQEALNWKPKDSKQEKALELAISDTFNLLVSFKGFKVNELTKLFYKAVQEPLDLSKVGVPDLATFLVQMRDKIQLKRERYTGRLYLFPKFTAEQFAVVAHISELVSEQRVNDYHLPDESMLSDCELRELFMESYNRSHSQNFQTNFYGSYRGDQGSQIMYRTGHHPPTTPFSNPSAPSGYVNPQFWQTQSGSQVWPFNHHNQQSAYGRNTPYWNN